MEPLTAGAIALATLLLNKTFEKTGEIIVTKTFEQGGKVIELLNHKSPKTAGELEAAAKQAALPPGEPEYIGEAVLVEKIESAAKADPDIRAAVEALGNEAKEAAKVNPELEKAIKELTEAVQAQRQSGITITNTAEKIYGNIQGGSIESLTQNFN
jgi:hypothetical protein